MIIVFSVLISGFAEPLKLFVSIVVLTVLETRTSPITLIFVPDTSDSSSANNILYMVTLQVPVDPFAPSNLTLLPLMSTVKDIN